MLKVYKTNTKLNNTKKINNIAVDSWIDLCNPSKEEINYVAEKTKIDINLLNTMLDQDELPRVEVSKKTALIVIDTPVLIPEERTYETYPLGIIISQNYIITISTKKIKFLEEFKNMKGFNTAKKSRFLIHIILKAANRYLSILKEVNKDIDKKESVLKKSTKNEDLIDLLGIEKTLVYFITSLKENAAVLERLKKGNIITLYEGDLDLLDDAVIEINEAIEISTIYKDILESIEDTYAAIVSNNLNNLMKFMAGMTIVLSVPTMISSFLGMNVPFGDVGKDPFSYLYILIASILISVVIGIILKKKGML